MDFWIELLPTHPPSPPSIPNDVAVFLTTPRILLKCLEIFVPASVGDYWVWDLYTHMIFVGFLLLSLSVTQREMRSLALNGQSRWFK